MKINNTESDILKEIEEAEAEMPSLHELLLSFWRACRIKPALWAQYQYSFEHKFWVVALIGDNCLYFNFVEGGWGWGKYNSNFAITKFHCQQDEIQIAIYGMLDGIMHKY